MFELDMFIKILQIIENSEFQWTVVKLYTPTWVKIHNFQNPEL